MATYTEWTGGGSATSTSSSATSSNTWVTYRFSTITVNVFLSNGKPTHTVEAAYTENHRDGSSTTYTSVENEDYSITVTDTDTLYSVTFYSIARGATDDLTRTGGEKTITFTRQETGGGSGGDDSGGGSETDYPQPTGSVVVIDNGNNTFYIQTSYYTGYNACVSNIKWYYIDDETGAQIGNSHTINSDDFLTVEDGLVRTADIDLEFDYTNPTPRIVFAECSLDNDYHSGVTHTTTKEIYQYLAPVFPDNATITITTSTGKVTTKEPWTLSWTVAEPVNDNSPVVAYLILGYKESIEAIDIENFYGNSTEDSSTTQEIDLQSYNLLPKDTVWFSIQPFTENGNHEWILSEDTLFSEKLTIPSKGTIFLKVGTEWKEGQVWAKIDNVWKEAETVYLKTVEGWKET